MALFGSVEMTPIVVVRWAAIGGCEKREREREETGERRE